MCFSSPSYGSMNTQQNPNGYGGPGMRYGQPSGDPSNMQYAAQNLPGTPYSYQQQAAGLYSTPFQSDPSQYGRWNWASQYHPNQGGQPPIPPGTPPPAGTPPITTPPGSSGGGVTPPAGGGQPPPTGGNGNPGQPQGYQGMFGLSDSQMQGVQRNPGAPSGGDIWTNPAFANVAGGTGGGGLFGATDQSFGAGGMGGSRNPAHVQNVRGQGTPGDPNALMGSNWWNAVRGG